MKRLLINQIEAKKDINLDEPFTNNGVDTFGGTNSESNAIDPDEYIPCSDGNTFCPEGCKCCVDADGDGLMECCPLGEPVRVWYCSYFKYSIISLM